MAQIRTDLAVESRQAYFEQQGSEPEGVDFSRQTICSCPVSVMTVHTPQAAEKMDKPVGTYFTVDIDALAARRENAFENTARCLAEVLRKFPDINNNEGLALVAGLGNRAMTPDALGPMTIDNVLVTRHLINELPEFFGSMRPVTALATGVLGTTGMEASELVRAIQRQIKPGLIITVDALASRSLDRLCRTVQLTDSGIVPGSGVGNARKALSSKTLGIPVISIGVPTVVDAATMAMDICPGTELDKAVLEKARSLFVTPRNIDASVSDSAKLIGYGINLALHRDLGIGDVDMLLS